MIVVRKGFKAWEMRPLCGSVPGVVRPFPIAYFRQILTLHADIQLMFDKLAMHLLFQVRGGIVQLGQSIQRSQNEMEAVQPIEDGHVEGGGNGAFFLVPPDMDVGMVGPFVSEPVNEPWISMIGENDWFVFCK